MFPRTYISTARKFLQRRACPVRAAVSIASPLARGSQGRSRGRSVRSLFRDGFEDVEEDSVGVHPFGLRFEVQDHPMPHRRQEDAADIVKADVVAAVEEGADFGGESERLGAAGTAPPAEVLIGRRRGERAIGMRGEDEADDVVLQVFGQDHFADELPPLQDFGAVHDLRRFGELVLGRAVDDCIQFIARAVADDELEKEAVQLCFGQRVGSFLLDRVLRGEDEERLFERVAFAGDGDGSLLHGLEHGRLGLRRGAVDFVGEENLGEDRTFLEFKEPFSVRRFHDHVRAEDIRRHQVGRELNAIEVEVERLGKCPHQECFAKPGNAFQQTVPADEQASQHAVDDFIMADDDTADLFANSLVTADKLLGALLDVGHGGKNLGVRS